MTNMSDFEEACELIEHNNLQGKVGIHFKLTEGYPITEKMALCRMFCDANGKFKKSKRKRLLWLSNEERQAVCDEYEAQLNRLLERNIIPKYIITAINEDNS